MVAYLIKIVAKKSVVASTTRSIEQIGGVCHTLLVYNLRVVSNMYHLPVSNLQSRS